MFPRPCTRRAFTFFVAAVLLCLAALVGGASFASAATRAPTLSASQQAELQATLDAQMAKYKVPGAIVGMWFPTKGTWVVGSGVGDKSTGAAPQTTDRVRIGSLTKSFTATVVLQLVDEKKLALTDKLNKYAPWVPGAKRITVRQLLNMTSGLYNFTDVAEFWEKFLADPAAIWTPRQLVDLAIANPAVFPPGQEYMYCNTNYVLLGMIIEKVTGRKVGGEITRRIIDRLGLKHSSFPVATALPAPYMHGYVPAEGEPSDSGDLKDLSIYSPTPFWTAGGMVSTLGDLRIWMKAIVTGKLLSKRMHAAQLKFSAPNTASYGLGVMNAEGFAFGHSGEVPGYNSSMYYIPAAKAISITLINRYPSAIEGAADQINFALIDAMAGDPDRRNGFTYPDPADFSALSWTAAFTAAHDKFSREYAFSAWKGVDWPGLYERFLPRIEQAQAAGDEKAYYLALHEYVCSIPDGHISLSAENAAVPVALGQELVGGGFGMAVAELDDWRVVAAAVITGGPADLAGIAAGAEIVTWGARPARTALGQIDVGAVPYKALTGAIGGENPKATRENYRLEQARLLVRGPVGTRTEVVFKNPGAATSQTATLTAVDDGGQTFALANFAARPEFSNRVDYRILPEGYGYVLVRMEYDPSNPGGYPTQVYQEFQKAIASFVTAGVPGVIVDLRGNYGGSDQLAADMCGFFSTSPAFYEEQEYFDKRNGRFLRITLAESGPNPIVDSISIEPQTPYFGGPVVVLVNPSTTSSGEGPAMGISRLPNGTVIGFHGTNGSFGMVGGEIALPGGYGIGYPSGRSVDQTGVVQLDSRNGIGGVAPDVRVPKTLENVLAFAAGTDVELHYAVEYLKRR
jgi:carboxyl-terminal processing protease